MTDQHKLTHRILKVLSTSTHFYHLMDMLVTVCEFHADTHGRHTTQKGRDYKKLADACEELAARAKRYNL